MRARSYVTSLAAALAVVGAPAREASAQAGGQAGTRSTRLVPSFRADGFAGRERAAHVGAGLGLRLGTYAQLDVVGAAGASAGWEASPATRASGRVDVLGRFALDPFEQFRRGPYAAAGLSLRVDEGARRRVHLTAVVGVEGRPRARWLPALEAGFGGGVRVGVVLRRAGRSR